MIASDYDLATYCEAIYRPSAPIDDYVHFDIGMDDGVCWGLRRLVGYDVVIFRGSLTLQDWICDFRALAVPSRVGHVHAGFLAGMEKVWAELKPLLMQPAIVTGHSLGAARAAVLAGLMTVDMMSPILRVGFGEPKPGLIDFGNLVGNAVPARSYRNGDAVHHDLVTDVPLTFPPEDYVHPTAITPVCFAPDEELSDRLGIFAWHHMPLYVSAMGAPPA